MHDHHHHHCRKRTIWSRRDFLFQSGGGIAGLALADMLDRQGLLAAETAQSDTCEGADPGQTRSRRSRLTSSRAPRRSSRSS